MAKPIVMTIDDEPHVLNAIARDLQGRYQKDYQIVKASSGAEALSLIHISEPTRLGMLSRMPSSA